MIKHEEFQRNRVLQRCSSIHGVRNPWKSCCFGPIGLKSTRPREKIVRFKPEVRSEWKKTSFLTRYPTSRGHLGCRPAIWSRSPLNVRKMSSYIPMGFQYILSLFLEKGDIWTPKPRDIFVCFWIRGKVRVSKYFPESCKNSQEFGYKTHKISKNFHET